MAAEPLQTCRECRTSWNNEFARLGPCDKCLVRQKDRCTLIEEFLQTEILYNDQLLCLRESVQRPLDSSTLLTPAEHVKIFGELKDLIYLSNRVISLLNEAIKRSIHHGDHNLEKVEVGRILLRLLPHYSCYVPYIIKQETNLQVLRNLESSSEDFRLLLWEADIAHIDHLTRMFLKPFQRIHKLPGFVDQILEKTPLLHADRRLLQSAQTRVSELIWNIQKYSSKPSADLEVKSAPPKPKRNRAKKIDLPNDNEFGKTFTKRKCTQKRSISLNPFDSETSTSSNEDVEVINYDSLDRAYNDIERTIESIQAHTIIQKDKQKAETPIENPSLSVIAENLNEISINVESEQPELESSSEIQSSKHRDYEAEPLLPCNGNDSVNSELNSKSQLITPTQQINSVSAMEDEFLFDGRALCEISDMELSDSIEEFDLGSRGSELELLDLSSILQKSSTNRINQVIKE